MKIGVISDTHGLLRPEALRALAGVEAILHAGDVGDRAILEALGSIAPVTAIRGNIDRTGPCSALPATEWVKLGGAVFYLIHDEKELDLNPGAAGISVVVSGHSHQAKVERSKGVLYLNPGSAGPRRFRLPVTLARVTLDNGRVEAEIVELEP
ncbi:MAG TPA: metallophosphoesterase family protein [Acidobacteriaceae bacterium]|nr:metallophosphoesterase family protein [Acidobacteriaceae bacterium]